MALKEMALSEAVEAFASDSPAPGGGSAAALSGALGASLVSMVAGMTLKRPKYALYEETAKRVRQNASMLKDELLSCMDRDTKAYLKLSEAFKLPKENDEDKRIRRCAIQEGLVSCIESPMKIMELCLSALKEAKGLLEGYNTSTASDLGVAALTLKAAAEGAWLNVLTNLNSLKDEEKKEAYEKKGIGLRSEAVLLADLIHQKAAETV